MSGICGHRECRWTCVHRLASRIRLVHSVWRRDTRLGYPSRRAGSCVITCGPRRVVPARCSTYALTRLKTANSVPSMRQTSRENWGIVVSDERSDGYNRLRVAISPAQSPGGGHHVVSRQHVAKAGVAPSQHGDTVELTTGYGCPHNSAVASLLPCPRFGGIIPGPCGRVRSLGRTVAQAHGRTRAPSVV